VPTAFIQPGLTVDMTAVILGIETPHSNTAVVPPPIEPQAAPSNFRFIHTVADLFLRKIRALGSALH